MHAPSSFTLCSTSCDSESVSIYMLIRKVITKQGCFFFWGGGGG